MGDAGGAAKYGDGKTPLEVYGQREEGVWGEDNAT